MTDSSDEYCAQEVRRFDSDRWLTTLFAPDVKRPALLALYAFNSEIARARESVTQPMIGQIRLQWWREAWEGIAAGRPRQQPIVQALYAHRRHLDIADAIALIDGRERDMDPMPLEDLPALEAYAVATSVPLMRLAASALEVRLDDRLHEAIQLAGVAYALVGLLRATPFLASQQRIYLPADHLIAAGLMPEAVYQKGLSAEVREVIGEVARHAERMLRQLRRIRVGRQVLPALLPATLARAHLRCLTKAGFDPEALDASATATRLHIALVSAILRRRA